MGAEDELACDRGALKFDEACVDLRTEDEDLSAWLYSLSADCASVSCAKIQGGGLAPKFHRDQPNKLTQARG